MCKLGRTAQAQHNPLRQSTCHGPTRHGPCWQAMPHMPGRVWHSPNTSGPSSMAQSMGYVTYGWDVIMEIILSQDGINLYDH